MHVLILDDDCRRQVALSMALSRKGFQTGCAASRKVAEACIRGGLVDLLVMPERLWGRLTHALALLAEWKNPMVSTLMLTDRTDADVDELYLLLPSLHGLVAPDACPDLVAQLALASVSGRSERARPMPFMLQDSMRVTLQPDWHDFADVQQPGDREAADALPPVFVSARAAPRRTDLVTAA